MASDYVGRYGAALRQLSALETGGLGGLPSAVSPGAPSAFVQAEPPVMRHGAFDAAEAQGAPAFGKPMSARDLYKQLPPEQKAVLLQQVEKGGMSVDDRYDSLVASGEVEKPTGKKKLTKEEKLGYLAEVALRTISNMSRQGTDSSADWADAVLTTDARRGALEQAEQERARQQAEVLRKEGREDAKEERVYGREDKKDQRQVAARGAEIEDTQAFTAEQNRLNRESQERMAQLRAAQDANQNAKVLMADDGSMFTLQPDGSAKPIVSRKTVKKTPKGAVWMPGARETEVIEEQLRGLPKADLTEIDRDTVMRAIGDRIKAMKEDSRALREMKRQGVTDIDGEIARRATQQVMQEYGVVSGKQAPGSTRRRPITRTLRMRIGLC
jgi:hypothetical protein